MSDILPHDCKIVAIAFIACFAAMPRHGDCVQTASVESVMLLWPNEADQDNPVSIGAFGHCSSLAAEQDDVSENVQIAVEPW